MDFFESVINFFSFFTSDGEGSFWHSIQARIVIWFLMIKIWAVQQAWTVAELVFTQLDISGAINSQYNQLDSGIKFWLTVFRVPEVISIISNAYLTRYVLRLF